MAKRKIQELTTGVHDFPTLINGKETKYVDKTGILYELARKEEDAQYFISRPRRFGKSLMLSTLQAMFEGRRDLFKGLAIYDKPWEGWKTPTPVYSFTMSKLNADSYDGLVVEMEKLVRSLFAKAHVRFPRKGTVPGKFDDFIAAAAAKSPTGKIVVLIDEYDEPVAGFLDNLQELNRVRKLLHDFYEKLKINSASIRFLMMTGVTKLTKLSVFSGLTHLTDLSADKRFATLLGYTHSEIDGVLRENVEDLGRKLGLGFEPTRDKILKWFDGYRFSPQTEARVVNPVSLGKLFSPGGGVFKSYWETTGGSTLIFNRIKAVGKMPDDLENVRVRPIQLDVCDAETLPIEALLYQSGYLTIKEVFHSDKPEDKGVAATDTYRLAPPNEEIRHSLRDGYVSRILGFPDDSWEVLIDRAKRQIRDGDIQGLLYESLFGLYAQIPPDWQIKNEADAKRYFLLFTALCGANPQPEVPSLLGYADAVIETPKTVYVFEFKCNKSSKAAIRQIRERGYADKWKGGKRPVTLVGINFNSRKRNIDIPVIEPL